MTSANDRADAAAGDVSVEEAREILHRFCASHFDAHRQSDREKARISIPADPLRDDDIRLGAFITRAEMAFAEVADLRAEHAETSRLLSDGVAHLVSAMRDLDKERGTVAAQAEVIARADVMRHAHPNPHSTNANMRAAEDCYDAARAALGAK